eukprot:scaffold290988_cov17-Prasinocladus_malaysianus.AAC.1
MSLRLDYPALPPSWTPGFFSRIGRTGPSSPTGYLLSTVHVRGSHFATLCMSTVGWYYYDPLYGGRSIHTQLYQRLKAIVLEYYVTYDLEPPALPQSIIPVTLPAQRDEGSQWSCGTHAATIQRSIMLAGGPETLPFPSPAHRQLSAPPAA